MWQIRFGLGGGFGGFGDWEACDATTREEDEQIAFEGACIEYETYEGLHGLRSTTDIMEEDEVDEEEAWEIFCEEREGWLCYEVREIE